MAPRRRSLTLAERKQQRKVARKLARRIAREQNGDRRKLNGRPPGAKNIIPKTHKEAINLAIELYGRDGKGTDGLVGFYFLLASLPDKTLIVRLIEKILPTQISGPNNEPIPLQVFSIPPDVLKVLTEAELKLLIRVLPKLTEDVVDTFSAADPAFYAKEIGYKPVDD